MKITVETDTETVAMLVELCLQGEKTYQAWLTASAATDEEKMQARRKLHVIDRFLGRENPRFSD